MILINKIHQHLFLKIKIPQKNREPLKFELLNIFFMKMVKRSKQ